MTSVGLSEAFMGRELGRALNKTDFFRAFKMHADYYGLSSFMLLRFANPVDGMPLEDLVCLSKLAPQRRDDLKNLLFDYKDEFLNELAVLKRPKVWNGEAHGYYAKLLSGAKLLGIPHVTTNGTRYCVLLGDEAAVRDGEQFSDIIYDFMNIARRYCDYQGVDETAPSFSRREREVTEWTSEGKTTAEIAIILGLSEYTVNEYIASAMKKIDAVSRGQLVAKAIRLGVID